MENLLIRCPMCDFTRDINLEKIPQSSEFATCPKCGTKFRFRFRTLTEDEQQRADEYRETGQTPSIKKESDENKDIWDVVESLNIQWAEEGTKEKNSDKIDTLNSQGTINKDSGKDRSPNTHPGFVSENDMEEEQLRKYSTAQGDSKSDSRPDGSLDSRLDSRHDSRPALHPDRNLVDSQATNQGNLTGQGRASDAESATSKQPLDPEARKANPYVRHQGDTPIATPTSFLPNSGSIPWEYSGLFMTPMGLIRTTIQFFINTKVFFSGLSPYGSSIPSIIFALIFRIIASIGVIQAPSMSGELFPEGASKIGLLIAMSLGSIIGLIILGYITNFLAKMVSQGKAKFSQSLKVVCYSNTVLLLTLIPIVYPFAALAQIIVLYLGFKFAYGISWLRAVLIILPIILLATVGVALYSSYILQSTSQVPIL